MKMPIKWDEAKARFFIERRRITSGRIAREGYPNYGVVFTTLGRPNHLKVDPPPDLLPTDTDFDTTHLVDAIVAWKDQAGSEEEWNRLEFAYSLQILGGYFYHADGPKKGKTTRVFGIAKEAAFEITEDGTTTVDTHWELVNSTETFRLDETQPRTGGWTFVVAVGENPEEDRFPHSSDGLALLVECPHIQKLKATIEGCSGGKRMVTFRTDVQQAVPKSWTLHFGDGESMSGEGMPPGSIEHAYAKAPASVPRLCVRGTHVLCEETCVEVELTGFEECPPCPEIQQAQLELGGCEHEVKQNRLQRKAIFRIGVTGEAPAGWRLDFGDGEQVKGSGAPPAEIEHLYAKAPDTAPRLTLEAEPPCESVSTEIDISAFEPCPPCPQVDKLDVQVRSETDQSLVVELSVQVRDGQPNQCRWDWGDGSPAETTTALRASHTYRRMGKDMQYTAHVELIGPYGCRAHGQTPVDIPKSPGRPVPTPPPSRPRGACLWLQIAVAFLLACTAGSIINNIAATLYTEGVDTTPAVVWLAVFGVLSLVAVAIWFRLIKLGKCEKPGLCGWGAITWGALFASGLVALYLINCTGWWFLVLLLLAMTALLLYKWLQQCESDLVLMLLHFAAGLVAAGLISLAAARPLFAICL